MFSGQSQYQNKFEFENDLVFNAVDCTAQQFVQYTWD